MNTRILIFGLILLISCKKAEVKPVEPTPQPVVTQPTPKQERVFKVFGRWDYLVTKLKGKELINPFNAYVGDTVSLEVQSGYYYELDIHIYLDNTLYENKVGGKHYKTNVIIK